MKTPPLFSRLRTRIAGEAAADLEPPERFTDDWNAWWLRDLDRMNRKIQIAEAEALTTYPEDPAPVASQGLAEFIAWSKRQQARRCWRKPNFNPDRFEKHPLRAVKTSGVM